MEAVLIFPAPGSIKLWVMQRNRLPLSIPLRAAITLLATAVLPLETGCTNLNTPKAPSRTAAAQADPRKPAAATTGPKQGFFHRLGKAFAEIHLFPKKKLPPKAEPLRRTGVIRTLSNDGSYVIVELEPGVMVSTGTELMITRSGGTVARLKVAEMQTPYFVADVISGTPAPGDVVQR